MGIYGHAFDKQYTSAEFLSDLDKSFYAAESVIDDWLFQSSLLQEAKKKEETGLAIYNSADKQYEQKAEKEKEERIAEKKNSLSHRLKEMIVSFMKWFKEVWDKLIASVKKAVEKMRDLTLRDKAMNKLFSNFKYDQLEEARDKGWQGLLYETTVMCNPANMHDSEIIRLLRRQPESNPADLNKKVFDIASASSIEDAEKLYNELKDDCDIFLRDPSTKVHNVQQIQNNRDSFLSSLFKQFGMDDDRGKVFFTYMRIKNPKDDRFGWPDQSQFDNCKSLALDGEKYVNTTRRDYYNDHIKELEEFVNSDIKKVLDNKVEVNDLSDESNKIMGYHYKAMLLTDKTQLTLHNRICTEIVRLINYQIKTSISTFMKIMSGVKTYTLVNNVVNGKEEKAATANA